MLRSYARCLAADILCVWRRVSGCSGSARPPADAFEPPPPPAQPPPLSLASAKELWIFWYGEEPDLNELVAPELNMSGKFHFYRDKYCIANIVLAHVPVSVDIS